LRYALKISTEQWTLLQEIILIDDLSTYDYLQAPLEEYILRLPVSTRLVHLPIRSGLIQARLHASTIAKGPVLLFLDSHIEVNVGWLEPLLVRLETNKFVFVMKLLFFIFYRTRVVAPIIDVISDETFEFISAADTVWGGFNWKFDFRWNPVSKAELVRRNYDRSEPIL
jgi:polypeptide N-acetylgalactosaminyltransferase